MVVGIDDVLYIPRPKDRRNIAIAMRNVLQLKANDLDKKKIEVQIICKGKLTLLNGILPSQMDVDL